MVTNQGTRMTSPRKPDAATHVDQLRTALRTRGTA